MTAGGPVGPGGRWSIVGRFLDHVEADPDRLAIDADDRAVSYEELAAGVRAAVAWLEALGVARGDRVAYLGRNRIEFFELLLASAWTGALIVPVNWRLAPGEVEHVVRDAEPSVVVAEAGEHHLLDPVADHLRDVPRVVLGEAPHRWSTVSPSSPVPADLPDEAPLWLIYTSGTTGLPKGVVLTHGNLRAMFDELSAAWRFLPGRVTYTPYPVFHAAGIFWVLGPLLTRGSAVLRRQLDPGDLAKSCRSLGVTNTMLVPSVLQRVLDDPEVDPADLQGLRTIVYGVAPISEALLERAMATLPECELIHAYGLTEATGAVTVLPWAEHRPGERRMRSCGRPYSFVELRIADPATGEELEPEQVGEVWVRGPVVMAGYFRKPEETAEAIRSDGWLRTGDAGYVDADGYLYLTDRIKDMIITGGENVYPAEVENVLHTHPRVREVAVVGVPDDRWGETVKAVVVREPGTEVTVAELISWCRDRLAHYKCPTSVDFVDELPKNATGKILRRVVREPYWAGHDRRIS